MRLLAKEIVASRRTVARLHENKAQMNSVSMMLTEQLATVRSVGHLEKSTEVLSAMNGLVRNADVRDSMREMSKEMAKSGLIEELVNDALEDINGVDDLEAETDAEVNKILAELAGETAVAMPGAERARVAPKAVATEPEPSLRADSTQREAPIDDLQARLDAETAAHATLRAAHTALKIAGGLYLLYLAWRIATAGAIGGTESRPEPMSLMAAAMFQWVNPKAWMMGVSAMALYTDTSQPFISVLMIATVFGLITFPSVSVWTGFGTALRGILEDDRRRRIFNIVMGVVLALCIVPMVR